MCTLQKPLLAADIGRQLMIIVPSRSFLEDTQIIKVYFVPLVPRVLNHDAPWLRGAIFLTVGATKLSNLKMLGQFKHALWDLLVFRKVCPPSPCGSAPFSQNIADFPKISVLANANRWRAVSSAEISLTPRTTPRPLSHVANGRAVFLRSSKDTDKAALKCLTTRGGSVWATSAVRSAANAALSMDSHIGAVSATTARALYYAHVEPHLTFRCEVVLDIVPLFTETGIWSIRHHRTELTLRCAK
ncbi:hypothetical protein LXA43DRAFT_1101994 [Ganoderma leucocontextum]|nr:hypothetical protein LXA43DRAFT_1101994 [Ganoderma leucocontextum]